MPASYQATLLGGTEPAVAPGNPFERIALNGRSWVDVSREWLHGGDTLLDALVDRVDWRQGRRTMWERVRDGNDSVAPHADRELRVRDDTLICIVTVGARRPFLVKPKTGGRSVDVAPGSGDLLVMGGATQLEFTHAVPKVAQAGPRISMSWRWTERISARERGPADG